MGITALGGLVVAHSIRVGGYELDDAIVQLLLEREKLLVGQGRAEAVRLEVGSAGVGVEVPGTAGVAGRSLSRGLLRRAVVDADQIRSALSRPLARIVDAVKNVLERTPAELSSEIGQRGLMLVGGGALARPRDPVAPRDAAGDHRRRRAADQRRAWGRPRARAARRTRSRFRATTGQVAARAGLAEGDKGEPDDDDVLVVE